MEAGKIVYSKIFAGSGRYELGETRFAQNPRRPDAVLEHGGRLPQKPLPEEAQKISSLIPKLKNLISQETRNFWHDQLFAVVE